MRGSPGHRGRSPFRRHHRYTAVTETKGRPLFERFTDRARRVLVLAQEEARDLNHAFIGTEHILLGLIREGEGVAAKALDALGVTFDVVREKVEEAIGPNSNPSPGSPPFTPRAKKVLELSLREALQLGHSYIGTEHMLLGLVREGDGVAAQVLNDLGADMARVRTQVIQMMSGQAGKEAGPSSCPSSKSDAESSGGSAVLDQFGRNLTQFAREGKLDPLVGRDKEVERVMQVLSRRTKNNPVLIGEPGVGKTAIVEGLAQKIVAGQVPAAPSSSSSTRSTPWWAPVRRRGPSTPPRSSSPCWRAASSRRWAPRPSTSTASTSRRTPPSSVASSRSRSSSRRSR